MWLVDRIYAIANKLMTMIAFCDLLVFCRSRTLFTLTLDPFTWAFREKKWQLSACGGIVLEADAAEDFWTFRRYFFSFLVLIRVL